MDMKKTSVYLSEEDRERLKRLAERKGESQAWVLREALLAYDAATPDKNYAIFNAFEGLDLPPLPEFKSAQEYNDWLEESMREGLLEEYQQQLEDMKDWKR
ncbi:MAG: CopG family transcriptional regulator [Dehalococcoidia bacterium]